MEKIDKPSVVETPHVSGLDMSGTIRWYQSYGVGVPPVLDELRYPIENPELIGLSDRELGGLISLFPKNAQDRSILRKIIGKPATWFSKKSTREVPDPTTSLHDAQSATSIIPSYIDYAPWKELRTPTADVWLYQISSQEASQQVRKVILSEGFVHEVGHSIVQPALWVPDHTLKFPDGTVVSGFDAMMQFAGLAEQHVPISHYSATYRGVNNKFEGSDEYQLTAISEELCETIAAYLLGFAYCGDSSRGRDPFADRSEIKKFVSDFLNAELITIP